MEAAKKKKKKIWPFLLTGLLVLALLAAAAGAWIWYDNIFTLDFTVKGAQEITLEYGESYEEQGAEAWFYGTRLCRTPMHVAVTRSGKVDPQRVGSYRITYSASYRGYHESASRFVHIVDTKAPVIILITNPDSFTVPNQPYQEEGFTAFDNYDGDLTDKVQRTEENGVVTYTVTDSSGNSVTVKRTVNYADAVAPELKLKGDNYIVIKAGSSYTEPGYEATDNADGDLTDKVQVSGGVDVYAPGSYTLTYTVKDSFENAVSVTRTVCVLPMSNDDIVPPTGKVIYLTFDDGPSKHTGRLLDVLAKYNVKATFFLVNTDYISEVERIYREGHAVAIHTTTHKFNEIYASDEAYFNDLYKMQGIIESYTGHKSMLLRFPGGSSNTVSKAYSSGIMTRLTQAVQEQGFRYFDWNVDSKDAGGAKSASEVFWNVVNGIGSKQDSVILQHDTKGFSVDAVERIIIWGLTNGYTFLPLDANSPGCHHGVRN